MTMSSTDAASEVLPLDDSEREPLSIEPPFRDVSKVARNIFPQHPYLYGTGTTESLSNSVVEENGAVHSKLHVADEDTGRMERMLDLWCSNLRRDILAEVSQNKIRVIATQHSEIEIAREKARSTEQALHEELLQLKELLNTYESSLKRKDQMIETLTVGIQQQRLRRDMMKNFSEWKISTCDARREAFAGRLALAHSERRIKRQVHRWRQRVEKACQARAQEVCVELTKDYESKLASVNEALQETQERVSSLQAEREKYEESMKKAFMRGVCALNMEAMGIFHTADDESIPAEPPSDLMSDVDDCGAVNSHFGSEEHVESHDSSLPLVQVERSVDLERVVRAGSQDEKRVSFAAAPHPLVEKRPTSVPLITKPPARKQHILSARISATGTCASQQLSGNNLTSNFGPPPEPGSQTFLRDQRQTTVIVERHTPSKQPLTVEAIKLQKKVS